MKTICITGSAESALSYVADILQTAGMESPQPVHTYSNQNIASWHGHVVVEAQEVSKSWGPITRFGRFWEQLASDIFLANTSAPLWGWADSRSMRLLDFWLAFDPRLKFLLVAVSPDQMVAESMEKESSPVFVAEKLAEWQAQHEELLRFYHRNPDRVLLVGAEECGVAPSALIELCATRWNVPLSVPSNLESKVPVDPFALYLAGQLCREYPHTAELAHELDATIIRFAKEKHSEEREDLTPEIIIEGFRKLRDRSAEMLQLETAQTDAAKKNKDLLLQLHQMQEELEDYFRRLLEAQKQVEALEKEKASLTQERDTQAKLANDRQAQLAQNQKDLLKMTSQAEDLEGTRKQLKESEKQLRDATQENDLLLLQLHQVQEELEDYFLRHHKDKKEIENAKSRWKRMQQRHPDYYDYASVSVYMLPSAAIPTIAWRFCNLDIAERSFFEFEVDLIIEDGVAGFCFQRKEDVQSPLFRWPYVADQQTATIIPVVKPENSRQRYDTFIDLSATDWGTIQLLGQLFLKALHSSLEVVGLDTDQRQAFIYGLERFLSITTTLPPLLRYDEVELINEQVNTDYEHLWLHLKNMTFNEKRYSDFEFRVSCANVSPDHFGKHPKLEFPEARGQEPFESWFKESSDDFGSKLEVRFALPSDMDMDVWWRMSDNDKMFFIALTNCLPYILRGVQKTDVAISRSWEDWMRMSVEMQSIIMEALRRQNNSINQE